MSLSADARWTGQVYFTSFNVPVLGQAPVGVFDAYASYTTGNWTLEAYVKNISDELVRSVGFAPGAVVGTPANVTYDAPRTFGVKLTRSL